MSAGVTPVLDAVAPKRARPILLAATSEETGCFSGRITIDDAPNISLSASRLDGNGSYAPERHYDWRTQQTTISLRNALPGYYVIKPNGTGFADYARFLFIHPPRCFLPAAASPEKALMVQLYALRSDHNWGVGDFSDLSVLLQRCEGRFAYVGLNPLHALNPNNANAASPYAPDSRALFHELYLDVAAVAKTLGAAPFVRRYESTAFQNALSSLRVKTLIDYEKVYRLKIKELAALFQFFTGRADRRDEHVAAFHNFVAGQDKVARRLIRARGQKRRFFPQSETETNVLFEYFLQWQCERQLSAALSAAACKPYFDLAIGAAPDGVELVCYRETFDADKSLGAEPDEFCADGQKWKIAPFNINALRASGYDLFRKIIRQNMKFASALRIDNIASFYRRFIIDNDAPATSGSYENVPYKEFFAIIAIESHRHQCAVIGEDLGAVPSGLRTAMRDWNILGCLVYQFEYAGLEARSIDKERERNSIFSFSTHDCPPLVAFWRGRDIDINQRLGRIQDQQAQAMKAQRRNVLKRFSLFTVNPDDVEARKRFLDAIAGKANARIKGYALDDLLGEPDPVNIPGTDSEYPNWRRKYQCEAKPPLLPQ